MEQTPEYQYRIASKGKRLLAHLLEGVIYLFITLLYYSILGNSMDDYLNREINIADFLYSALSSIITGFIFYPVFSGNLGHKLLGLKVISSKSGEEYKFASDGALRELLKYLGGFLILPVVWLLWDKENQNLYDKVTETFVVENYTKGKE
ncbi:RDD family protein [Gillisia marina]|uniref:RDD family protein n=1 Tax=Gillisia marina TaxID=1167637 RepID=UPI00029B33AC|nr:RDD family protein [Gillisia marina]